MKKILIILAAVSLTTILSIPKQLKAQSPEKISYQSVVRNSNDELVREQELGIRIQILQDSEYGASLYVETQTPTTNTNGLFSIEIGSGTVVNGDFASIDWSIGTYFLKTEIDLEGGTNYTITGISQLLSVPYALYAKSSGSSIPGPQGDTGADGKSAYEIAVEGGYIGTETEWLASLCGTNGTDGESAYKIAVEGGYIGTVTEWLASINGTDGVDGKSAYEIAVSGGYTGTETEWLASLNGVDGIDGKSAYEIAVEGGYTGTDAEWLASLNGTDGVNGKSAYEIAVTGGYTGTETEWLASLNGADGIDGKSAYEIAVEGGYTGTDAEWLASINGTDGADGECGHSPISTSVSSLDIANTGEISITLDTNLNAFAIGQRIRIISTANIANFMEGNITAFDAITGFTTVSLDYSEGSGTSIVDWTIVSTGIPGGNNLPDGSITNAKLADNAVTSLKIANASITTTKINVNAINSSKVADNSLTASDLAPNSVGSSEVIDNSLTANDLAANSVGASEIAANSVYSTEVADNSLTASDLAANSVGSSELATNSVYAAEIATGAVGTSEVADNSLTANDLAANSVGASEIAAGAVGVSEIATGAVYSTEVANNSLYAVDIRDEPGLDFYNYNSGGNYYNIGTTESTITTITVSHPASGYVVCIFTGSVFWNEPSTSYIYVGWDNDQIGTPLSYTYIRSDAATNRTNIPVTNTHTFTVSGAGTTTFYIRGKTSTAPTGTLLFYLTSKIAMYFPTRY